MSDYRFEIGDKVQRRLSGSSHRWQDVTVLDTGTYGRIIEYQFDNPPCFINMVCDDDDFRPRPDTDTGGEE